MESTLSPTATLELPVIADLEKHANSSVAWEQFAIAEGRRRAHTEIFGILHQGLDHTARAALAYLESCRGSIEGFQDFSQLRFGVVAPDGFKVLAVLPLSMNGRSREFRKMARLVETFFRDHSDHGVHVLTLFSDAPDMEAIEADFPMRFSPSDA